MTNWSKKPTYRFSEAIRVQNGLPLNLEYHARRMVRSLGILARDVSLQSMPGESDPVQENWVTAQNSGLSITIPADVLAAELETGLAAALDIRQNRSAIQRQKARLLWDWFESEGICCWIENIEPYRVLDIHAFQIIHNVNFDYVHKYIHRQAINDFCATLPQGVEAIFVSPDGRILESGRANLALRIENIWYTPSHPLHLGTTRDREIISGRVREADLYLPDLQRTQAAMLLNAMLDWEESVVYAPFLLG